MSELDLLNLARSATQDEVSWFAQLITINFAMVVAIYYFLHEAKLALKLFGFVAYMIGSMIYLGEMLIASNIKFAAFTMLKALPSPSPVTRQLVGVTESWLGITTAVVFNGAFWVLWLGVFYLLFFWRRRGPQSP
ncbi:MAG: hypothetical protein JOZ72_02365 [Alphaproteobacteria bacterium]|nr:hypothetical protein [Alphaproteobacteria bacterium]